MRTCKLTLLAFAAIAAMATSCSNDELNDNNQKGIAIKATAGTPQGGADTRLTHTDGSTHMNIVWATGDAFTVYESASNQTNYTIEAADAGKSSASFTGVWNLEPSAGTIHALYPANATTDPAAITLSLEGQEGTLDGLKDFNYMTAGTTYSGTGDLTFGAFAHRVAIVKLVLIFSADVTATEATEVGLKATGLSKSAVLNLITGDFSNHAPGNITTGINPVAITDNKVTAYLCVFAGALTDAKAIAKVGNDNYTADLVNLDIVAGKMYTATVTMAKQAVADYIEMNGVKVAVGNLVADGEHDAKIGAPTDGGLYFQFGSLVGWSGGTSDDGTGTPVNGSSPTLKVIPNNCTVTSWSGSWTGDPITDDEVSGKGDPCRYYLKGTWRLPTKDEYKTLFNNTTSGWTDSGDWSWDDTSKCATNSGNNLIFPGSGIRLSTNGNLSGVGDGSYWSASLNIPYGYCLMVRSSTVIPSGSTSRASGLPVRCVRD